MTFDEFTDKLLNLSAKLPNDANVMRVLKKSIGGTTSDFKIVQSVYLMEITSSTDHQTKYMLVID